MCTIGGVSCPQGCAGSSLRRCCCCRPSPLRRFKSTKSSACKVQAQALGLYLWCKAATSPAHRCKEALLARYRWLSPTRTTQIRFYVGTPNGGVWATSDGGTFWKALTDKQATLSISSLDIDPTDKTHKTLIAGSGLTSSSCLTSSQCYATSGGNQNGLLYSQDGGKTWKSLGGGSGPLLTQSGPLSNQTVVGVAARGTTMLAATFQISGFAESRTEGGLYLSQDGGPFKLISGASGANQLPSGPVTSLVGVPGSPNTLYAAVTASSSTTKAQTAVYVTIDAGANWTKVFSASDSGGASSSPVVRP